MNNIGMSLIGHLQLLFYRERHPSAFPPPLSLRTVQIRNIATKGSCKKERERETSFRSIEVSFKAGVVSQPSNIMARTHCSNLCIRLTRTAAICRCLPNGSARHVAAVTSSSSSPHPPPPRPRSDRRCGYVQRGTMHQHPQAPAHLRVIGEPTPRSS
jgi:hypothetical protein